MSESYVATVPSESLSKKHHRSDTAVPASTTKNPGEQEGNVRKKLLHQGHYPRPVQGLENITIGKKSIAADMRTLGYEEVVDLINERNLERRRRTSPPEHVLQQKYTPKRVIYDSVLNYPPPKPFPPPQRKNNQTSTRLCGASVTGNGSLPVSSTSRVVITGVLDAVGVMLTLHLAQECGVQHILGLDAILPNTMESRASKLQDIAMLQQAVPHFELMVPMVGLQSRNSSSGKVDYSSFDRALEKFQPTHIVHFPPRTVSNTDPAASSERLYHRHERLVGIRHLFGSVAQLSRQTTAPNRPRPHVLYFLQDDFLLMEVQVLASAYYSHFGVSSVGLHLSKDHAVYGGGASHLLEEMAISGGLLEEDTTTRYIFIKDAVRAILAGMHFHRDSGDRDVTLFAIGTRVSVTQSVLEKEIKRSVQGQHVVQEAEFPQASGEVDLTEQWLGWKASTSPSEGAKALLEDSLSRSFPYGHEAWDNFHWENTPSRPMRAFPCASECSYQHFCDISLFDNPARVSQNITSPPRRCKYVIYTTNLSPETETLPKIKTTDNDLKKGYFICYVAFVSSASSLAKRLVKEKQRRIQDLTGKVGYKGWQLVFVPGNAETMSEADYILPKISPGKFFSRTVLYAMYVDPTRFSTTPPISWSTFFQRVLVRAEPAEQIIWRSGTETHRFEKRSEEPPRSIALLVSPGQPPFKALSEATRETAYFADLFLNNRTIVDGTKHAEKQLQLYNRAAELVEAKERRPWELVQNAVYPSFPFDWVDSKVVLHHLKSDEARLLRCEWYDEHTFWGNRDLEDLSLAYVLAKRKLLHKHEPPLVPKQQEPYTEITNVLVETGQWTAIRVEANASAKRATSAGGGMELFVRILDPPMQPNWKVIKRDRSDKAMNEMDPTHEKLDIWWEDADEETKKHAQVLGWDQQDRVGDFRIHKDWHPRERSERFPSVKERIKLYMSNWYHPPCKNTALGLFRGKFHVKSSFKNAENTSSSSIPVLKVTDPFDQLSPNKTMTFGTNQEMLTDVKFLLEHRTLMDCVASRRVGEGVQVYCSDSLELLMLADKLDNSSSRTPLLAIYGDTEGIFGDDLFDVPFFAKHRAAVTKEKIEEVAGPLLDNGRELDCLKTPRLALKTSQLEMQGRYHPIIWNLNSRRHFFRLKREQIETDTPWELKKDTAVWRGALAGTIADTGTDMEVCKFNQRCRFVHDHRYSKVIDCGLIFDEFDTEMSRFSKDFIHKQRLVKDRLKMTALQAHKILISLEGNDVASGLKWSLQSESVVLMPPPTRTSWAMEELLQPWVHYVPMFANGSNAEEMVQWVRDNDLEARRISERATLFMYDLFHHPDAEKDDYHVKTEILRRYRALWHINHDKGATLNASHQRR